MFDLTTGHIDRPFSKSKPGWTILSLAVHTILLALIVAIPLLYVTNQLPTAERIEAFVVAPQPAPPPPPPPPAAAAKPTAPKTQPHPVETPQPSATAAPVEAPDVVVPQAAVPGGVVGGVPGGVEGGEVGGVTNGIVGGIVGTPPPPAPTAPVRVGGQITTPQLVKRVEPRYPAVAVAAKLSGTVILELTVDDAGRVTDVEVLRSQGLLDKAAVDAVKQWRYSPLVLNGIPTPFIVTVTMNFSMRPGQQPQVAG